MFSVKLKSLLCILPLLVSSVILIGCQNINKTNPNYHLLFTEDVVTFGKQTSLVSFDQEGNALKTTKIDGALYYNLLPFEDKFKIDNGLQEITISSKGQEKTSYPELRGYFEVGHYLKHNNQLIKFYNYGIDEELEKYFTKIEKDGEILTIEGNLLAFQQDDNLVYLIFQEYPDTGFPYYFATLDLQQFSITIGDQLPFNENTELYFFEYQEQGNGILALETDLETNQQNLLKISTTDPQQIQTSPLNFDFNQLYYDHSLFTYQEKTYIFDNTINQLYQIIFDDENNEVRFEKENLQLGGYEENFIVHQRQGDKLYILNLTIPYQFSEIDLSQMTTLKQVKLETVPQMKNLKPYSFFVED